MAVRRIDGALRRKLATGLTVLAAGIHVGVVPAFQVRAPFDHAGELFVTELVLLIAGTIVLLPRPRRPDPASLFCAIAVSVPLLVLATQVDRWHRAILWTLPTWGALVFSALFGSRRAAVRAALQCAAITLVIASADYSFSCPPPDELVLPFLGADNRRYLSPHVLAAAASVIVAALCAIAMGRTSPSERLLLGAIAAAASGLGTVELFAGEAARGFRFTDSAWTVGELANAATVVAEVTALVISALSIVSWLRAHEGSRAARGARNAWRVLGPPLALFFLVLTLRDPASDLPRLMVPEGVELPTAPRPTTHWTHARESRARVFIVDRAGAMSARNGSSRVAVHPWHRLVPAEDEVPTLIFADRLAPLDAIGRVVEVVADSSDVRLVMQGTLYPETAHDHWAFTRRARPRPVGVSVDYLPYGDERFQRCYMGTGNSCSPPFHLADGLVYLGQLGCSTELLVFPEPFEPPAAGRAMPSLRAVGRWEWPPPAPTEPLSLAPSVVRFWPEGRDPLPNPWPVLVGAVLGLLACRLRTWRALVASARRCPAWRPPRGPVEPSWLRASEVTTGWTSTASPYRGSREVTRGAASPADARRSLRRQRVVAFQRMAAGLGWLLAIALPAALITRIILSL